MTAIRLLFRKLFTPLRRKAKPSIGSREETHWVNRFGTDAYAEEK